MFGKFSPDRVELGLCRLDGLFERCVQYLVQCVNGYIVVTPRDDRQAHPETRELFEDTLVLARKEHLKALSMLCVRLVSVRIREMDTFRRVGGPVVTFRIGGIIVETTKFDILSNGDEWSHLRCIHVGRAGLPS